MSKKILSIFLALVMVFSLVAPVIPAAAEEPTTVSEESTSDLRIGVFGIRFLFVKKPFGNRFCRKSHFLSDLRNAQNYGNDFPKRRRLLGQRRVFSVKRILRSFQ